MRSEWGGGIQTSNPNTHPEYLLGLWILVVSVRSGGRSRGGLSREAGVYEVASAKRLLIPTRRASGEGMGGGAVRAALAGCSTGKVTGCDSRCRAPVRGQGLLDQHSKGQGRRTVVRRVRG